MKQDKLSTIDFDRLWDYSNPAATELKFRSLLDSLVTQSGVLDPSYRAELMTQIARATGLQGKFPEAHSILDSVEQVLPTVLPGARIRYLLERGRVYNSSGERDKARQFFLEAWDFGKVNHLDFYAVDAAHMLGISEPPEDQIIWNQRALDLAEKSKDKRSKSWLGPLYNNLAWTYFDSDNYDQALFFFQKDLNWRTEIGDESGARIAKWSTGRVLRAQNNLEEALVIQKELELEIDSSFLEKDGYLYEELAELYLLKNDTTRARHYFSLAYEILSQDNWLSEQDPERLARMKNLGE
ncbi:MAG: hypothetical protein JXB60_09610 [Candidatus Cloacimonetes bacterium]|nr:hypothetical protein [Candidatus Cloacimonadota bacterium]